jgi:hypothetical protein
MKGDIYMIIFWGQALGYGVWLFANFVSFWGQALGYGVWLFANFVSNSLS